MNRKLAIIAGPNGCGKSTLADYMLKQGLLFQHVDADVIARGLNGTAIPRSDISAGRIMLQRLHRALEHGESISFESTMSGRSWLRLLHGARQFGYEITICYIVVRDEDLAVERVARRVHEGGHDIPEVVVHRRFRRSLSLFVDHYRHACDRWYVFDNTGDRARMLARMEGGETQILDPISYGRHFGHERQT